MRCSKCGERVSFLGVNCSHCHADKSDNQAIWLLGVVCLVSGPVAGAIFGGGLGFVLGIILGGMVFLVTQAITSRKPPGYIERDKPSRPPLRK
jgi:hypothetical protein